MAEDGAKYKLTAAKSGKTQKEKDNSDSEVENNTDISKILHRKLSDVGAYSYSALCAVSFLQLYEDKLHNEFKKVYMERIVDHLHLPSQARDSVMAIMEGQGFDDARPYVDMVLDEPVLEKSGVPVVSDLVALSIAKGCYDSRMRVLIKHVAWQLRVSWDTLEEIEASMADSLESASHEAYEMSEEELKEKQRNSRKEKAKRFALIGLATTVGGTLIGLTGGLAAPLVAAGAGAIIGGTGAAVLGSTAGVAIIGSLFGVAGAGLTGYKMKKRVGAVEEFEFEPLVFGSRLKVDPHPAKQLHITLAVSGWLSTSMTDFRYPWYSLAESREQYSLRWESKYLIQLGQALDYLLGGAMSVATQEALKYTVLSGILTAIAWPATLLSVSSVIDNPWSVCIQRATSVGRELAEVLLAREQGQRPVTLIGFSLGARVVFSCLEELSKRKGGEGIIEDAVLLGAPVSGDPKLWSSLTRVVGGKIINGYCRGDWLLKFLFRTASVHLTTVAGLSPIKWDSRRMHNIDLSDVVNGHKDYLKQLDVILKVVGVRTKGDVKLPSKSSREPLSRGDSCDSYTSSDSEVDTSSDVIRHTNLPADQDQVSRGLGGDVDQSDISFVFLPNGEECEDRGIDSEPPNPSTEEETEQSSDGFSGPENPDTSKQVPTDQSDLSFEPIAEKPKSQQRNQIKAGIDSSDLSFIPIDDVHQDEGHKSEQQIQCNFENLKIKKKKVFEENLKIKKERVCEDDSNTPECTTGSVDQSDFSFVKISEDSLEANGEESISMDLSNRSFKQYLGTVIDCDLEGD
ncbi:transmembrane and coiled-coil domain-containing protein 4-like [Mizuhopecten yessoensis]|uniref:Transmembrane and coiled-coil domain-containing protein 4 n=1 Tax=Mizuhopecten yessoensis TaxID=6573 RepID=A0A210PUY7_MIZYE|nr:transmembrane and coiled-coil domain-containing protein 4-like [Mizuhopecten yessoensis]OWF40311.1 Transmembrane and coiled-coil domain-containing protein 4 [Mizuhopecten yessoensis]